MSKGYNFSGKRFSPKSNSKGLYPSWKWFVYDHELKKKQEVEGFSKGMTLAVASEKAIELNNALD
jgi:hypothetical protein